MRRFSGVWAVSAAAACMAFGQPPKPVVAQAAGNAAAFQLETADGVTVYGWQHGDPGNARGLLLLFHQGGANADAEYGPLIPRFLEEGYAAITIDQRSGGSHCRGRR